MSRRSNGLGEDPRVIPFRPRPKPPRVPPRWRQSLRLFLILFAGIGVLRALYAGMAFNLFDLLFVVLLAGAIALGDLFSRRG